jgi:hypothetical protein
MSQFEILPKEDPENTQDNQPITFYVMEGEAEQYRCSSREEARNLIDGLEKRQFSVDARKKLKKNPVLYEFGEILIAGIGLFADLILKGRKDLTVSDKEMLPPYNPPPAAPKQPDPPSAQIEAEKTSIVGRSTASKLDRP